MPIIASFYGITIIMHLRDHNPPHVHAEYAGMEAMFTISDGLLYRGEFPHNGCALVKQFILMNSNELMEMWQTENYHKLPPLK